MTTEEDLVKASYKKHKRSHMFKEHADCLYQKAIRYGNQRFYFINFWKYNPILAQTNITFEIESQLTTGKGWTFDAHLHYSDDMTVESIENFFFNLFNTLECKPYDREEEYA